MSTALQTESRKSSPMKWSVYAGLYMFIVGGIVSLLLSDILSVLVDVISIPGISSVIVFACPALIFGTGTWWAVVERRDTDLYRYGAIVGVATALLTGTVWTTVFVVVWGVEMVSVPIVGYLVVLVVGIAVLVGGLAGLLPMYARRRVTAADE
jgi:hypothetical protein